MEHRHLHHILKLGPRVPAPTATPDIIGIMDSIMNIEVPNRVLEPRSDPSTTAAAFTSSTCKPNDDSPQCQKPVSSSTLTLPIILGVALPVVGAAIAFLILHRRHVRKTREEDADERHARMDFGLGEVSGRSKKGPNRSSEMDLGEKDSRRPRQVSMDMTMDNSPYLLPPELQNSRESLHSLSRTIHQREDPYRGVAFATGDGASFRSHSRQGGPDASSIYTASSAAPSRLQDLGANLLGNAGGMARSIPPTAFVPPPRQNSLPQTNLSTITPAQQAAGSPLLAYPTEPPQTYVPDVNTSHVFPRKGLPNTPRPGQNKMPEPFGGTYDRETPANNIETTARQSNSDSESTTNSHMSLGPEPPTKAPERQLLSPANSRNSPPMSSLPSSPRPPRQDSIPVYQPSPPSTNRGSDQNGFQITPPSPPRYQAEAVHGHRYSMDVPPEEFAQAGLGAPGFDARRVSMGFRPLPPDELTEVDDPELRANRIRSFYKEYFDESKPMPQGQYYEDYDESYLGDAAYYDPGSNNFVMPYAQPVTRRAMTPPPGGQRYQGPYQQGPPRGTHGSVGAMSMNSMHQPQMYPPGPYPQGPRAFSTASGGNRRQGPPRRPMPPPTALNSLPTPGKLRDDSFALMNATDFAPPQTYRDRQAGRSESPLGERRPYEQKVPAFAPLQSAFEELPPVPSPHLLRKSGTFTGLDFAPPKRFKDADSMSDAGSIRSNRSGVSAVQLGAIRKGAYRVSRIPQDVVFTRDDMATSLKPQWGMRAAS